MAHGDEANLKARQEKEYEAGLKALDKPEPGECCQTAAPREVPARESLLNWINAIEQDLLRNLTRLQQAKDVIYGADEHTLRIVKQLVELDFQRRF